MQLQCIYSVCPSVTAVLLLVFNVFSDYTLENVTFADFNEANNNDETERHQLPHSKDILDPGGHPDTAAVHPCQQH